MTKTAETGATVLLPCPFCGGAPVMMGIPPRRAPEQWVKCTQCGASSDTTSGAKRASDKWNTRAVNRDARFTDVVAALEGLVATISGRVAAHLIDPQISPLHPLELIATKDQILAAREILSSIKASIS